jgi:hypothetical protein
VLRQRQHVAAGSTRRARDRHESVALPLVAGQAGRVRADPQRSLVVDEQGPHECIGKRRRAGRLGLIDACAVAVPAHEPGLRAQPQETLAILGHRHAA